MQTPKTSVRSSSNRKVTSEWRNRNGLSEAVSDSTSSGVNMSNRALNAYDKSMNNLLEALIGNGVGSPEDIKKLSSGRKRKSTSTASPDFRNGADKPSARSFSFPVNDDTFTRTVPETNNFTRSSADDINAKFASGDGLNAWQFSAGSLKDPAARQRAHSSSRADQQSPKRRPTMRRADELGGDRPVNAGATNGGFDAESWSQKIGPQNFVPHPPHTASASPTRGTVRRDSRKIKPAKPTMGNAGMVAEDSSSDETHWRGRQAFVEPVSADSPNAMDIDTPPPEPAPFKVPSSLATGPRKIPLEPSRPEWRAGDVNGLKDEPAKQEREAPPAKLFKPTAMGSEDTDEFRASLSDLKNVEPLAQPPTGLNSFGDLKANLPFESQAGTKTPVKKHQVKAEINFPKPPMAPRPPLSLLDRNAKPSDRAWARYVNDWQTYIRYWDDFDSRVTHYFWKRKEELERARKTKGYSFLGAEADTGCNEYLDMVHEDNEVRNKWAISCREHEQRVREFMAYREVMMK
jgi:hypothetical protein